MLGTVIQQHVYVADITGHLASVKTIMMYLKITVKRIKL